MEMTLGEATPTIQHMDSWAYLDWPTGIMRINATNQEWLAVSETAKARHESAKLPFLGLLQPVKRSAKEVNLTEAVVHEWLHYLQICVHPYLYWFVTELAKRIQQCWPRSLKQLADLPVGIPKEILSEIKELKRLLSEHGPRQMTIETIIESEAFLLQKRTTKVGLKAQDYDDVLLTECPAWTYRNAFDIADESLGQCAFDAYPFIAALSLATNRPAQAFVALCESVGQSGARDEVIDRWSSLGEDASRIMEQLLGTLNMPGVQLMPSFDALERHDWYGPSIETLRSLVTAGKFQFVQYVRAPWLYLGSWLLGWDVPDALVPPLVFNPRDKEHMPVWIAEGRRKELAEGEKEEMRQEILLLLEVSTRLQNSAV